MADCWQRTRPYVPDVLAVAALLFVLLLVEVLAQPFERVIRPDDPSIAYPFADPESVPTYLLMLLALVLPVVVITTVSLVVDGRSNNRDLYPALLGLMLTFGLTGLLTDVVKVTVGRLRPDFLARCQYDAATAACTGDEGLVAEGRKSFPSGHSSFAWAGLGFLSLYLAGKLHLFDGRGRVWKLFVVLVPLMGAYLVAVSRVIDYRHHPADVIVGAILGYFVAYFCYRQYFPALVSPHCDLPYAATGSGEYDRVGPSALDPLAQRDPISAVV